MVNQLISTCFVADRKYFPHFATAATSLLENNRDLVEEVFLLTDHMDRRVRLFEKFCRNQFQVKMTPVVFDIADTAAFRLDSAQSSLVYAPFFLPKYLPPELQTVLNLDTDLIIQNSIRPLFDAINLANNSEENWSWMAVAEPPTTRLLEFGRTGPYFNSGVTLVNLQYWRDNDLTARLVSLEDQIGLELGHWDQDPLNLVCGPTARELPEEFNVRYPEHQTKNSIVLHFIGREKPWILGSRSWGKSLYWEYRNKVPNISHLPSLDWRFTLGVLNKKFKRVFRRILRIILHFRSLSFGFDDR